MALTPTSRRAGFARRALSAGAAVALAATATLVLATPASAHTWKVEADCTDEGTYLKVNLQKYNTNGENTVTVIADEETIVDAEVFEADFVETFDGFDPTVEHTFTVVVVAHDDPTGDKKFSFEKTKTVEACVEAPPTTTTVVPPTTTEEVAPTTTAEVAPTTPGGGESGDGGLADTGASIAIPLVLGVLMLVGGGALLIMVRRRGQTNA